VAIRGQGEGDAAMSKHVLHEFGMDAETQQVCRCRRSEVVDPDPGQASRLQPAVEGVVDGAGINRTANLGAED
jgi:hypothetical protein